MRERPILFVVLSLLLTGLTAPALVSAQAPLRTGYGGPVDYGSDSLPTNDDGSSPVIDLTTAFPGGLNFFGTTHTTVYVNTNGNITFSNSLGTYTPAAFPVASRPMIAPYWGDVDIRGPGFPTNNGVFWAMRRGEFVATWHNVGYYNTHDDLKMDFQMILTNALDCGSGDFDVEFRYNRCEWTTGDASSGSGGFGGTPAQAGFDAGDGVNYVEIPGSRTMAILDLCTTSNVGETGVWRFGVRGGAISCPGTGEVCDTGMPGVCGVGLTQCIAGGVECVGIGSAGGETCDGIDNDCNGTVDEGDLCEALEVCSNGRCVPPCFEGGCSDGFACTDDGACVDAACVDVVCPANERCEAGACIGACEGVTCPHDRVCRGGRCLDVCSVVTCGTDEICEGGTCVRTCPCRECEAGAVCGADGSCTPLGCDLVTCEAGFYCEAGECRDACAGAVCPSGQTCQVGECVAGGTPPTTDGGTPPPPGDGGTGVDGSITGDSSTGGDVGPGRPGARGESGCACDIADTHRGPGALPLGLGLGLFLGLVGWRSRRRRS